MNVAVTGVGGGVGQSIIKALQNTEYNVIGIDGEVLGTGLYATKKSYLSFYANHPKFIDRIIEICKKEKCKTVFPGLDVELIPLSNNIEKLKANDIVPIVSDSKVIKIADDKLETTKFLRSNDFPYIKTYRLKDYTFELDFPVVLKPQKGGARSIGNFVAKNKKEFNKYILGIDINNYVVQEYIQGDEYTCGAVSFESGCIGVILMKRQLRCGDTYKAFVIKDEKLSDFVKSIINVLKPFGACNIQLRVRDNIPYIFEINARCSGTTASRALAGFNEPKMICDYIFKCIDNPHFEIKEIAILRYWKELVVSYDKIEEMKANSFVYNKGVKL
jgi:carbamoyl-phosphate synthase large subunit